MQEEQKDIPHFISENAVLAAVPAEEEPVEALKLVVMQSGA